jgi:hypothetical protein
MLLFKVRSSKCQMGNSFRELIAVMFVNVVLLDVFFFFFFLKKM